MPRLHNTMSVCLSPLQRRGKVQNSKNIVTTAADKKILFIVCYFLCFAVLFVSSKSANPNFSDEYIALSNKYFACEANGYESNRKCYLEKLAYEAHSYVGGIVIILWCVLTGALPAVTLIFILNLKLSKNKFSKSFCLNGCKI